MDNPETSKADHHTPTGVVHLVGAGPGDPGLITARGLELVRRAEVLVYDYLADARLVAEAPAECERIYVGKKAGAHTLEQEEINALLVAKCHEGRRVVRLKGGDPYVFGRGGEEGLALRRAGCAFEVVPGVTAAMGATAYAGIPVTHRGLAVTVTLVTGHEDPTKDESDIDWENLGRGKGTLVFYMGVRNLPQIAEQLVRHGRAATTPVALVRWGTTPRQETLTGTLETIAREAELRGFRPPALIVVGDVVGLRNDLSWFERRPLFGRRIVVTRSRAQAGELSAKLEALGAQVTEFPVIRIAPPVDMVPLLDAARRCGDYDWIIFTSVNAFDAYYDALRAQGRDSRAFGRTKLCAIGSATAARLEERGLRADLVPAKYVAESLMESLRAATDLAGKRILLPRSEIARGFLPEALREAGALVDEVEAYRTILEEPAGIEDLRREAQEGAIDAVTFASSSTVRNFVTLLGEEVFCRLSEKAMLASIGPETSKTIREFTAGQIDEAGEATIEGLVRVLCEALRE